MKLAGMNRIVSIENGTAAIDLRGNLVALVLRLNHAARNAHRLENRFDIAPDTLEVPR